MAASLEQFGRDHRAWGNSPEEKYRFLSEDAEEDHKMLMHFSEEKYRLAQQAYEVLQMNYLELTSSMGLLKQEIVEHGSEVDGYEECPVQSEAKRSTRAKEAIKKEHPSPLTRVHSQSGFSGLSPQLSTPPRPSPSPSPHLSTPDLVTDLGMPEPLMPMNHGRSMRLEEMPISEDVLFQVRPPQGMSHSAKSPQAPGRLITHDDINVALQGLQAELFWPDDNLWYLIQIHRVDVEAHSAQIIYTTGETEILNLDEIVQEGHMSLIT